MLAIAAQLRSDAFPVAFHLVLSALANAKPLYHYAVRSCFDVLVAHYREIPSFGPYFDLVAVITIDGASCQADFLPSALARASLGPVPAPSASRRCGFAFLVLMHRYAPHLAGFRNRLQSAETVFVMVLNARSLGLTEAAEHRFASIANLSIAERQVKMCWGCASLTYGRWMGVQAALRLGSECDWFSLHSAVDALLRSPEITKALSHDIGEKQSFVATGGIDLGRVVPVQMTGYGFRSPGWMAQGELKRGLPVDRSGGHFLVK
jgi:hypothetical protein